MMKPLAALALGLAAGAAACGAGGQQGGNGSGAATGSNAVSPQPEAQAPPAAVPTAQLTGLYEGGSTSRRDQLCIVDRGAGDARFGLLVWGQGMYSCSGAGVAVRAGTKLTLRMTGDSRCEIAATLEGGVVTLPQSLPSGCSYYCASSARLEGARFTRTGATADAAMKARDFTGDPLCEG